MAEKTLIAWTNHTANFWLGCMKISPGCANCYAETLAKNRMGLNVWGPKTSRKPVAGIWAKVRKWNRESDPMSPARVFVGSMMDWAEDHSDADKIRPDMWRLIRECRNLHFQMLTKRADRIASLLPADWGNGYANVWLGVSIESNPWAWRADYLRSLPAAVRFVSYEPALGPLDALNLQGIDWLIYGGESGPGFRPEDKQWARDIKARCEESGTAFFHKQSAAYRTEVGIELDGKIIREYPKPRLPLPVVIG